jgi:hypothetical protein
MKDTKLHVPQQKIHINMWRHRKKSQPQIHPPPKPSTNTP